MCGDYVVCVGGVVFVKYEVYVVVVGGIEC